MANQRLHDALIGADESVWSDAAALMDDGVVTYWAPKGDRFYRRAMDRIDRVTGIPIKRVRRKEDADILCEYKNLKGTGWAGVARSGWWQQPHSWRLESDNRRYKGRTLQTIVEHEVGHAFGLEHVNTGMLGGRSVMDSWSGPKRLTDADLDAITAQFEPFL